MCVERATCGRVAKQLIRELLQIVGLFTFSIAKCDGARRCAIEIVRLRLNTPMSQHCRNHERIVNEKRNREISLRWPGD